MALSNKNSSGGSQLDSLLDLLMDLQVVNQPQVSKEETSNDTSERVEATTNQLITNNEADLNFITESDEADLNFITESDELNTNKADLNFITESNEADLNPIIESDEPNTNNKTEQLSLLAESEENLTPNVESETDKKEKYLSITQPENYPDQLKLSAKKTPEKIEVKSKFQIEWEEIKAAEARQKEQLKSQNQLEQQAEWEQTSVVADVQSNQSENQDTAPEKVFNRLISSQWQSTKQSPASNQSMAANSEQAVENSIELFERWQRLMLTQQMMESQELLAKFKIQIEDLENQVNDPSRLINLIVPLISAILSRQILEAREEAALTLAPIVDSMIQHRTHQDKKAMSLALSPILADAVTQQIINSPGDFAKALGPEMGNAIKEQIHLERDAMVDALYPVIGSTVSKYFAEAVRAINEKVEQTFSLEGVSRKVRAKLQGVSEAELIFRESIPFTVQAIFLIQKTSGLVIAEVQPPDKQQLESEMVAGMLTAIRSFVNDCIAQSGEISEIDQIDYGNSKIILEVAGYCYLATVIQGEPPKSFKQKMRTTLSNIIINYDKPIEAFDGDPNNVPKQITPLLKNLTKWEDKFAKYKGPLTPVGLILLSLGALAAIFVPLGIHHHWSTIESRQEENTKLALESDPELAIYRLGVDANRGTMKLSGLLPNQYLRLKAERIAQKVEPKLKISNAIIPVEVPANPVSTQAEMKRVTNLLNQMDGAVLEANFKDGKVTVQGTVLQETDAKKVTEAFQQIPGVQSVTNTVQLQPLAIASRVYFDQGSSELKATEISKISQIKAFLDQYPTKNLKLVGHTDPKGSTPENQQLALERAVKVKDVLVNQGVDSKRLQNEGTIDPPIGIKGEQVPLLSRCVEFKIISP
jgi:outer membrane protein OmpA-like peptidoglycan-associated protein